MAIETMLVCAAMALVSGGRGSAGCGGGGPAPAGGTCVTAAERAAVEARIAANRARMGIDANSVIPPLPQGDGVAGGDPLDALLYKFWPHSGTMFQDLGAPGYVDEDADPGEFHDYNCNPFTYDGHAGIDSAIFSFEEQAVGVPVYAALDGLVIEAHDGEPDDNTVPQGVANLVVIDHGLGRETWYFHLKKNSVAVAIGQFVKAGTQLALTGSSGFSWGPHLHFESREIDQVFDPFAGPCHVAPSGFVTQPPENLALTIVNGAYSTVDLGTLPPLPNPIPHTGQVTFANQTIYLWLSMINLPTNSNWNFKVKRPNGTVAYDTGTWNFGNPEVYRTATYYWWFDVAEMHTLAGQWSIDATFNGALVVNMPVTVNATFDPNLNRVPFPVTAALEPAAAKPSDALTCRVSAPLTVDDLDYDVIRYTYLWKVNNSVVRSVISAGRSDMLPRDTAQPGQTVTCTVTPSDGKVDGTPVIVSRTFAQLCTADLNADGQVNASDLAVLLGSWGMCQ